MDREVQAFKEAAARVVAILKTDQKLTKAEEGSVASEVGRVRTELGQWRKRRAAS